MITTEIRDADGYEATLLTIANDRCRAVLTDMGARLLELHVPDRDGQMADVVLGRETFAEIVTDPAYFGSTAGRFANRIRAGRFELDGTPYQLACNEGDNHLHGGDRGFDRYSWSIGLGEDGNQVTFWRVSPHGEENFPGTLTIQVTYRLEDTDLLVTIEATTDAPTLCNIVHHSYFNLAGHRSGPVLDHVVQLNASSYTSVDEDLLPTGEIVAVDGTPFDFRRPTRVGDRNNEIEHSGGGRVSGGPAGYDHNWVLDGEGMRVVAVIAESTSGRKVTVSTQQPGLHLYVGGYLEGTSAKGGGTYERFAGFTLESQGFPDAPNHPNFPSTVLRPGERYLNRMVYSFSTQ